MNAFAIGQPVKVRTLTGALVPRRIVGFSEFGPVVCREEEYETAKREGREPDAIGWPVEHIFAAD